MCVSQHPEKSPRTFKALNSRRSLGLYKQRQDFSNNDLISERSTRSKNEFYGKNYQQYDIIKHVDYNPFDEYKKSSINRWNPFFGNYLSKLTLSYKIKNCV